MLASLHISKYVLIDRLDLSFDQGFSIITGETGAGKSILLGALSLLMGDRADTSDIAPGTDKCVIEGVFTQIDPELIALFDENGLDFDPSECIIRRELSARGKSRAFVNDTPTSIATIKMLTSYLIDIHSQHKNLLLGDAGFQLDVLDLYAGAESTVASYTAAYRGYISIVKELEALTSKASESAREADYLKFQLDELLGAELLPQEETELEAEQRSLSYAQEIRGSLANILNGLTAEDASPIEALCRATDTMRSIERYWAPAQEYAHRLHSTRIELEDLASTIERDAEEVIADPERLRLVNDRLDRLNGLMHKHQVSNSEDLILLRDDIDTQLQQMDSVDERIAELIVSKQKAYDELLIIAQKLRTIRTSAAKKLSEYLVEVLRPLGMPFVRFDVRLDLLSDPGLRGIDRAVFLFSANKHIPPEPVANIASGGEIARLMLSLKALIAGKRSLPTILFDEIDTGVSGDIADRMGIIMQGMGSEMQVIAITHLPQIAARGQAHYYVYKETGAERTETKVRRLDDNQRIEEIARMQSGSQITDLSRAAAADLLSRTRTIDLKKNPYTQDQ